MATELVQINTTNGLVKIITSEGVKEEHPVDTRDHARACMPKG